MQSVGVAREDADVGIGQAVAVDIADRDPHRGLIGALHVGRDPHRAARILESHVAEVAQQHVRLRVVGHEDVGPAVTREVRDRGVETVRGGERRHAARGRGVLEPAAAHVAQQDVPLGIEPTRSGHDCDALEERRSRWCLRIDAQVAGDVQVKVAVGIKVTCGHRRVPCRRVLCGIGQPVRRVQERAFPSVQQQPNGPVARYDNVIATVGIEVADCGPKRPRMKWRVGLDAPEGEVAKVLVETRSRTAGRRRERGSVGEEQVLVPIAIEVDQRHAPTLDLNDLCGRKLPGGRAEVDAAC